MKIAQKAYKKEILDRVRKYIMIVVSDKKFKVSNLKRHGLCLIFSGLVDIWGEMTYHLYNPANNKWNSYIPTLVAFKYGYKECLKNGAATLKFSKEYRLGLLAMILSTPDDVLITWFDEIGVRWDNVDYILSSIGVRK